MTEYFLLTPAICPIFELKFWPSLLTFVICVVAGRSDPHERALPGEQTALVAGRADPEAPRPEAGHVALFQRLLPEPAPGHQLEATPQRSGPASEHHAGNKCTMTVNKYIS